MINRNMDLYREIRAGARRMRLEMLAQAIRCLKEAKIPADREPLSALLYGVAGISRGSGECLSYDEKEEGLEELFVLEPWKHGYHAELLAVCKSTSLWAPAFEVLFELFAEALNNYDEALSRPGVRFCPGGAKLIGDIEEQIRSLQFSSEREIPERGFRPLLMRWIHHPDKRVSGLAVWVGDKFLDSSLYPDQL